MKIRLIPSFSLLILLLASCAPATVPTDSPVQQPSVPVGVATSRGDELEATEPSTVSLASGGLQFVEFFRFT